MHTDLSSERASAIFGPTKAAAILAQLSRQDFTRSENTMLELTVPNEHAGLRIDRYLALALPRLSRSRLQALIHTGLVKKRRSFTKNRCYARQ